ncbi:MAG: transcriptional regulator [Acidobacteriota bacterium]|nr:MAG: transcriptional regulator [Acidobacteriota bacterium]
MLNTTRTTGKKSAIERVDRKKYAALLAETLPEVIESEKENDRLLAIAEKLIDKGEAISPEEIKLLKLLSHLIQEFEQSYYKPEDATPRYVLIELMAANSYKQIDLLPVFGSKGITSEVINGKRAISKANAKALGKLFKVPADLFL